MTEDVQDSPLLERGEQVQAQKHAPLRPLVIHEIVRAEGEAELKKPISALFWSAFAAGLSMGFSFLAQALLQTDFAPGPGRDTIASAGYSIGFTIVILGRQQLFTESTLTAVLPALHRKDLKTWTATLRLWAIVLMANIVGTWIFAAVLSMGHPLPNATEPALGRLAADPVAHSFGNTLLRSIFAGWLIALMVWLLPSAGAAKIIVIILLTWLVAFAKLSHVIAGSTEVAYAVLNGQTDFASYVLKFLVPTLVGNTIGGVALVAMLNRAPVSAEVDEARPT